MMAHLSIGFSEILLQINFAKRHPQALGQL
jgi:hypothetical protein